MWAAIAETLTKDTIMTTTGKATSHSLITGWQRADGGGGVREVKQDRYTNDGNPFR